VICHIDRHGPHAWTETWRLSETRQRMRPTCGNSRCPIIVSFRAGGQLCEYCSRHSKHRPVLGFLERFGPPRICHTCLEAPRQTLRRTKP
jgi:hypothetical protein